MGIAEDSLQAAVGTKYGEREQGRESLDTLHGSSWSQATRSLPYSLAQIRASAEQTQSQAGGGVGGEDALSFTHSNLHRAIWCNHPFISNCLRRSVAPDYLVLLLQISKK
jgi:hypothetical protein